MSDSGIKQLSADNWLMPDDVIRFFTGMERAEDYVAEVLGPRLSAKVPEDICALFDVARGTMLYGYLYYPLFTVGLEQLFRVGEAAIQHKCAQLAISKTKKRFVDQINWLVERDALSAEEADGWHALRRLRNSASHPTKQSITSPGMAIGILYRLSEDINTLFDGS
ncbi:DUF4145 domain-containing protein [Anaerobaca lacustris]|uniref:DUF4145 domain-containing protein n=1 Tax=Anaerobaca lacustris TaxID=3044600 RepID=A0AAW6TZ38_9BACT|nr:DUF4145 domain-containing protein [Sedimentisphaerales bacterium M17dextr]